MIYNNATAPVEQFISEEEIAFELVQDQNQISVQQKEETPNAFKILTEILLNDSIKAELKKRFDAFWNGKFWTVNRKDKIALEALLENEGVVFTLEDTWERFYSLTPNQKKAERLELVKSFVVVEGLGALNTLREFIKDFNHFWGTELKPKNFIGKSLDDVLRLKTVDDPRQTEHLKTLFEKYSPFDEKRKKEQAINVKISDLKNQIMPIDDVVKSLIRNERGDGELFFTLYKDKYVFDSSEGKSGEFYFWTGTHWQLDRSKQRYRDIETVAEYYEKASIELGKDGGADKEKKDLTDLLNKRAFILRSAKRIKAVFDLASTEIPFNGEWDHCPGMLPCSNGIIDLKNGKLLENKPEFFIRSICPTAYNPDAKRPIFDQFLNDITLENNELKSFLGRILGFALLGNCKEEKVFYLYGKDGRNGKGTLMQTLERVLGSLAKTFPSEMLLVQRNPPSSSTPRPEKANLQGVRFAIFSEINKGRKIDSSEVKNLSGNDTITCRRLFSNVDIQIKPSHTMFIQTNFKPEAPADDGALWKRNVLFPFNAEFVENPTKPHQRKLDEGFKERLLEEREGILAWLVEGCLEYQKIGLNIPEIVRIETENYRKENDGIGRFLSEMCNEAPGFSASKSKMEASIKEFCAERGCASPSRNEISTYLKVRFSEFHTATGNFWNGVKIIDERETKTR